MTYSEESLLRIYNNFAFSLRVYEGNPHLTGCSYIQALSDVDKRATALIQQGHPRALLRRQAKRYRKLIKHLYTTSLRSAKAF